MQKLSLVVFIGSTILAFVHIWLWQPHLPEQIPTHFGAEGDPDAWADQSIAIWIHLVIHLVNLFLFLGITFALPRIPDSLVNIPHKEHWLSAELRSSTHAINATALLFIATLTTWLTVALFELTARVSIEQRESISPEFWIVLLVYGAGVIGVCGLLFRHFQKLPDANVESLA